MRIRLLYIQGHNGGLTPPSRGEKYDGIHARGSGYFADEFSRERFTCPSIPTIENSRPICHGLGTARGVSSPGGRLFWGRPPLF